MYPKLIALARRSLAEYHRLTKREKNLVLSAGAALLLIGSYLIYEPIALAFRAQTLAVADLDQSAQRVGLELERYAKLESRRREIEDRYKEVEIREGALSYLETLLREKAGVTSGFTIKDSPGKAFGGDFEQVSFSVKFNTPDYEKLMIFLRELAFGERPLILSKVDVQMNRRRTALDVDLVVSTIRRVSPGREA